MATTEAINPSSPSPGAVRIYDTQADALLDAASQPSQPAAAYRVYKRRWYILAAYSLFAFNQGLVWNTWGPLKDAAQAAYSWSGYQFGLLPNWSPIGFVLSIGPSLFVVNRWGLRVACVAGAALMAAGAVAPGFLARGAVTGDATAFSIACHLDAIACGLACPMAMSLSPAVSAAWFPPSERVLATSVATLSNIIGGAFSFQLAHLFVGDNATATVADQLRLGVARLLWLECGLTAGAFGLLAAYFPALPASPCSPSGAVRLRLPGFRLGLTQPLSQAAFWCVGLAYAATGGVSGGFTAAFNVNAEAAGLSNAEADTAGFWSVVSAALVCLPAALLLGRIRRRWLQPCLVALLLCSGAAYLCFSLACLKGLLPSLPWLISAAACLGSACLYSTVPLFFELAADLAFPAPEASVCGLLTLGNNLVAMAFLGGVTAAQLLGGQKRLAWINWTMAGVCCVCAPPLACVAVRLRRETADRGIRDETVQTEAPDGEDTRALLPSTVGA